MLIQSSSYSQPLRYGNLRKCIGSINQMNSLSYFWDTFYNCQNVHYSFKCTHSLAHSKQVFTAHWNILKCFLMQATAFIIQCGSLSLMHALWPCRSLLSQDPIKRNKAELGLEISAAKILHQTTSQMIYITLIQVSHHFISIVIYLKYTQLRDDIFNWHLHQCFRLSSIQKKVYAVCTSENV